MSLRSLKARSHSFWDKIGMTVSSICFIHCLSTPVLLFTLPWVGEYFHSQLFHLIILLLVVPIGLYAFIQGYRHHKNLWVLVLGIPGLVIVSYGVFMPEEAGHHHGVGFTGHPHEIVTVIGSLFLIGAHYLNRRTCRVHHH